MLSQQPAGAELSCNFLHIWYVALQVPDSPTRPPGPVRPDLVPFSTHTLRCATCARFKCMCAM